MALDRTWYNTLVDDDGSNTVGSVWDKGDVNALMNTIDSEFLKYSLYAAGTWTPTLTGSAGASGVTYAARTGTYIQVGKLFVLFFNLALTNKGTISGLVQLGGLPFASTSAVVVPTVPLFFQNMNYALAGVYGVMTNPSSTVLTIYAAAAGAGLSSLVTIDSTYLTNTLQLGGTVIYQAA
jgi:hypothetical protein